MAMASLFVLAASSSPILLVGGACSRAADRWGRWGKRCAQSKFSGFNDGSVSVILIDRILKQYSDYVMDVSVISQQEALCLAHRELSLLFTSSRCFVNYRTVTTVPLAATVTVCVF